MAVQTQIQTRRGAAATWTSTNPTLAAGEIGFESDTNKFKIGTGSTAWASLPYAASISPLTTKGDLYTYSTADARLAVGANGETLVADSSTSTGLRYQGSMVAGKNAVINGGFDIWQRGTSLAVTGGAFNIIADRWGSGRAASAGGYTVSRQLTNDTTNLPFIQYCLRIARNSGDAVTGSIQTSNNLETVNSIPFVGKTVTVSAYIRKGADYSGSTVTLNLATGTGTDQNLNQSYTGYALAAQASITPTTTWVRYSTTVTLSSSVTELAVFLVQGAAGTASTANDYIEITGVQLEVGSVPTQFSRAGATIQGELSACQRYYWLIGSGTTSILGTGFYQSATRFHVPVIFPTTMRIAPSLVATSGTNYYNFQTAGDDNFNSLTIAGATTQSCYLYNLTEMSGTSGQAGTTLTNNAAASVAFNSEL